MWQRRETLPRTSAAWQRWWCIWKGEFQKERKTDLLPSYPKVPQPCQLLDFSTRRMATPPLKHRRTSGFASEEVPQYLHFPFLLHGQKDPEAWWSFLTIHWNQSSNLPILGIWSCLGQGRCVEPPYVGCQDEIFTGDFWKSCFWLHAFWALWASLAE